ncbi:MAG: dynamin family protein [Chloroflexi bacterium]|nr:dynamin family protein [Chloroflexota bacterium]
MAVGVLDGRANAILIAERALLGDVREALVASDAPTEAVARVRQAVGDLDQLFLLVVVGEFNAGKSAFVNALLGADVLPEGVTPTTDAVTIVRYGGAPRTAHGESGLVEVEHPAALLNELSIVDTPGTNAILRHHEQLTREFVPRSDLVLFVTSADRPFTESERLFLAEIRRWGKKVVVILNKMDLLRSEAELHAQLRFVREGAVELLGREPDILPLSARNARLALEQTDLEAGRRLWHESGFDAFDSYLHNRLDDVGRVQLKLASPLGVARRIVDEQRAAATARLELLRDDLRAGEHIGRLLPLYVDDLRRDLEPRLADIENTLRKLGERGQEFFDRTLRLGRIFDLFNADRIKAEFEREVVADAPDEIDRRTQDLIDWMVDQDLRLWRSISDELERRRTATNGGQQRLEGAFEYDRRALLQSVGGTARAVLREHDHGREAADIARSMREAVAGTTLIEAGALGLGALTVALVGSVAADVTGVLAAGVLAGVGLVILPLRKRKALDKFRSRTDELREALTASLRAEFEHHLDASVQRVRDALAPYDRFVRAERDRISSVEETLGRLADEMSRLQREIENLGSGAGGRTSPSAPGNDLSWSERDTPGSDVPRRVAPTIRGELADERDRNAEGEPASSDVPSRETP